MQRAVRPSRPAAAALVGELDQIAVRCQDDPDRPFGPLHVPEVAGVLDGDAPPGGRTADRWGQAVGPLGDPFVDVPDTPGESGRLGGADEMPVILEGGPATGRVDEDRRVAGEGD